MFPEGSRHLVVGFGITGLSLVKALARLGGLKIAAIDSRENPPNYDDILPYCESVHTGSFETPLLDQCDYLWVSPGIAIATPELQPTISRLPKNHVGGDIELFARLVGEKIIGITGTNGKSTVTTLVGSIFQTAGYDLYMGGNLGTPALDLWQAYCDRPLEEQREPLFLLELSSFQLETTDSLQANIGVILNISPDHLDRYRNYEHYIESKLRLFPQSQAIIVPRGEPHIEEYLQKTGQKALYFALFSEEGEDIAWSADLTSSTLCYFGKPVVQYGESRLGGQHNLLNMIAAAAIAHQYGVDFEAIERGIQAYEPLPHRSVLVAEIAGVRYFNDSKATNLSSTEAAILGFPEKKWLILGGVTKGQDFSPLKELLRENVLGVALIGEDYSAIKPHIPHNIPLFESGTLERAVKEISAKAEAGEILLFSPACASFDQFKSFEDRGDAFVSIVQQLAKNKA